MVCFTFPVPVDPLKYINDTFQIALSRPIGHLRDPKRRIKRLTDAKDWLEARSEDLRNKIMLAELDGEVPTCEALQWLEKVKDFITQISKIVGDHTNGSFRWGINRRAAHILADIEAFPEKCVSPDDLTTKRPPKRVQKVPAEKPLVTMDIYLSKIKTALEDDKFRIIGICGMGGVGKTTLLTSLNNNLGPIEHIFDYVIWPMGSIDYNLEKLQRDIAERLRLPLCADRDMQARKIFDFLENKSFLLLLDNLWNEVNFTKLGIPHPSFSGDKKQKVVFTTRSENVCRQMNAHHIIKMWCLNEAEAWLLFQEKVGEETLQANSRIPPLAQRVAQECDGLPLALVVIGSAMSTKKTPSEWQDAINQLNNSRPHEIIGMDDKFFSILKLSYNYLADELLRQCFLLCSLLPKDELISKTYLIEYWMGHGLIDEREFDTINKAYDRGYSFIGALQAACLLEPDYIKEKNVKMHDMIRDLALWIASDYGKKPNTFIINSPIIASKDSQTEVKRMSLFKGHDTPPILANYSELETLIIRKCFFRSFVPEFFERTRALTCLDISNSFIDNLPKEIGLLGNLRYLNLSKTFIRFLPPELGYLHELRFLILRSLTSIRIPLGVLEKLEMLSLIDMTNTWCKNPKELSTLRVYLKGIVLESIEDLHELAKLPNVQTWQLELRNLKGLNKPLQLVPPSHLGSCNIHSSIQILKIEDCKSLEVVSMESEGGDSNQKWCLSRLEKLKLMNLPKLHDIVWPRVRSLEMLSSLTVLVIHRCHNLSNISWVIRLLSLEYLTIIDCNNLQQIIDDYSKFVCSNDQENDVGIAGRAFPSLRCLKLVRLRSLRGFGRTYIFPSLKFLTVFECPKMKTLPFGMETGKKLSKISCGREWWEELTMEDALRGTLQPNFNEKSFRSWESKKMLSELAKRSMSIEKIMNIFDDCIGLNLLKDQCL